MRLLSRWQNSAGERVRIALYLKGIPFTYTPVSSLAPGEYERLNPQGLLPALDIGGRIIAQSSAILDYLEEAYPAPSPLPSDPVVRAEAKAFAGLITSEMHSLTVLRVRRFLKSDIGADDHQVSVWVSHWLALGLDALEETLRRRPIQWPYCFSVEAGWADLHLVPQLNASRRLGVDLSRYSTLLAVEERCNELEAFRLARPEAQVDFSHS
ncbi:maleylacetoacetate isomerase [Rhizobium sp. LEGMi198b]|uniref:maleylacetoacetate isomerase n=1 Tax=Rhizobium sp. CB3171 TaxID=3039157 RepID=UPI0024B1D28B|nr:maleylacetoacetate isomerase [Rhizobium sp. CB3171]WFU02681.1 maleylacetoacetate isomerase [Rhizobium sp. CB3171]